MRYVWTLLLGALLLAGAAECGRRQVNGKVAEALRAATHTRDSIRARNAEREIADARENDSLKTALRRYRQLSATVMTRADTVLLPIAEYVFITDSIIPKCITCAARNDSLRAWFLAERGASDTLVNRLKLDLQRAKHPRCGRKCGAVLGVLSTLAAIKAAQLANDAARVR